MNFRLSEKLKSRGRPILVKRDTLMFLDSDFWVVLN